MIKYLYFQDAAAIDGADATEQAIMLPVSSLVAIEASTTTAATLTFAGQGIGNKGDTDAGMVDVIEVECAVTAANFQEFCRQIAKFINADILNRDNSAYPKDGMLVVGVGTSCFHSTITEVNSITMLAATA